MLTIRKYLILESLWISTRDPSSPPPFIGDLELQRWKGGQRPRIGPKSDGFLGRFSGGNKTEKEEEEEEEETVSLGRVAERACPIGPRI